MSLSGGGAWDSEKVAEFRESYLNFERNVFINSKETGGHTCLGENLYESQVRVFDGICEGLATDVHDFKILKSRQLGVTTRARAIGLFWLGMFDGMRGAMIFDSSTNRDAARAEIEEMIANLPADVEFPRIKSFNREGVILENQSSLKFLHAGGRAGKALGASMGLNLLLASEMCRWENQSGIVSLRQSLAKTYENRLFIWESTARGYDGVWYNMWQDAKKDDLTQHTLFCGWWAHPEQVIEETDRRWAKYGTQPLSDKEKKRIESVYTKYKWEITAQQLAWYRWASDPTAEKDEDEPEDGDFTQEQPWDEDEAWQLTGTSFFSSDVLAGRMEDAARVKPVSVWKYFPGTDFVTTEFYPARTRRDVQLIVWEDPVPGASYVVAADPAFGHDEKNDRSALQVLRCFADGVDQVAEFASASTPTHQFAWLIASIVGWYGVGGTNPIVPIIEVNGPGEAVWREYQQLRTVVTNGYLQIEAKTRGLNNIFNNVRQYVYTRSDAMTGGHNYHWKCLALDTPLPTPTGWTTMGKVRVGDVLFDERGVPCNVIGKAPTWHGKRCFKVRFGDGAEIVADADHIWETVKGQLLRTEDLKPRFHAVPVARPLHLPEVELPIDPYVLGVWLGDGFSASGSICGGQVDFPEMVKNVEKCGYTIGRRWSDKHNVQYCTVNTLHTELRLLGLLENKRIPEIYLRASFQQRLALLQGLMDTDGSITKDRQCTFSSASQPLAQGFAELIRTLGIKASYLVKPAHVQIMGGKKVSCKEAYQFWFTARETLPTFRLKRKLSRQKLQKYSGGNGGMNGTHFTKGRKHRIVAVTAVPSVPVSCVAVDSPSQLFLASKSMIPTHNTQTQLKVAIMERLRDGIHTGGVVVRSAATIEEMRSIARDGDTIQGAGKAKDDRVFALAMGVRAWEEKLRIGLIAGRRTREADRARVSLSPEARFNLFTKNTLDTFFKQKQRARIIARSNERRALWRFR